MWNCWKLKVFLVRQRARIIIAVHLHAHIHTHTHTEICKNFHNYYDFISLHVVSELVVGWKINFAIGAFLLSPSARITALSLRRHRVSALFLGVPISVILTIFAAQRFSTLTQSHAQSLRQSACCLIWLWRLFGALVLARTATTDKTSNQHERYLIRLKLSKLSKLLAKIVNDILYCWHCDCCCCCCCTTVHWKRVFVIRSFYSYSIKTSFFFINFGYVNNRILCSHDLTVLCNTLN